MSISLKKETLNLNEIICAKYGQTMVEGDLIVPDVKPDISKALQVDGNVAITDKSISGDRAFVSGELKVNILYLPDGGSGQVKSMTSSLPFRYMTDINRDGQTPVLTAEAEVENMSFSLINSRKINIRGTVGINIKATVPAVAELAVGLDEDVPVEVSKKTVRVLNSACESEQGITVREQIELPPGKPPVGEVLKADATVIPREVHMLENSVSLSGEVKTVVLYLSAEESESLQFLEAVTPFEENIEVAGSNDALDGEADYCVKDIYCEVMEDTDGDRRILGVEAVLGVSVKGSETLNVNAVSDAYALSGEVVCTDKVYNIERIIDKLSAQITQKDMTELPEYMPDISQVFNCVANPHVESIKAEDGKVIIDGVVSVNILYMSEDENMPVADLPHSIKFNHIFNVPDMESGAVCDARAEIEHINYKLGAMRDIELRCVIGITVKIVTENGFTAVEEIEWNEDAPMPPLPNMIIYFVQPGDTLWNIAKRYRTTVENILEHNNVDSGNLQIGQRLFILR